MLLDLPWTENIEDDTNVWYTFAEESGVESCTREIYTQVKQKFGDD